MDTHRCAHLRDRAIILLVVAGWVLLFLLLARGLLGGPDGGMAPPRGCLDRTEDGGDPCGPI
jgi:hypothetical protein